MDDFAAPAKAPPPRFAPKAAAAESSPPKPAPVKKAPVLSSARPAAPKPAAAGPSKPAAAPAKAGASKTLSVSPSEPVKYKYSSDDALAQAADLIPADYHTKFADAAWKTRLEGAEEMVTWVSEGDGATKVDSEIMMRFLGKTPGWGEKNFQVSFSITALTCRCRQRYSRSCRSWPRKARHSVNHQQHYVWDRYRTSWAI